MESTIKLLVLIKPDLLLSFNMHLTIWLIYFNSAHLNNRYAGHCLINFYKGFNTYILKISSTEILNLRIFFSIRILISKSVISVIFFLLKVYLLRSIMIKNLKLFAAQILSSHQKC